ncbi:MAG: response regulator [Acidobacteriaceae bacterium]|jgi:DNA-binding response OmpR family regulator
MKRRILLVDDEVAVLLTLKAVLEINGFDVDTAASGREGKIKLRSHQYHMVITDMRMESDAAGIEVIAAARRASYRPAVALLTAFPVAEEDWLALGAHKMLVKPMHTRILLQQIEKMLAVHEAELGIRSVPPPTPAAPSKAAKPAATRSAKPAAIKPAAKKPLARRTVKKIAAKKSSAKKSAAKRAVKATKQ